MRFTFYKGSTTKNESHVTRELKFFNSL